mmetsp:Transcript_17533/g.36211  ORF Transcript_17533/g.36211 Transcript_17533/m.36211 type:complete len:324 (-) Transcript_17533:301-1272(-)
MATLLKLSGNGGRGVLHRNLSSSLPKGGPKRTSSTTCSSKRLLRKEAAWNRINLSNTNHSQYNRCYSTTRSPRRRSTDDKSNLPSTTSSSFMDRLKNQAAAAVESSKSIAEKTAKSVAEKASSTVRDKAKKATKQAQEAASKTLESTQRAALGAGEQAIKRVSDKASRAQKESARRISETAAGVTRLTSERLSSTVGGARQKFSEAASGVTRSTTETISKSTRAIGSGVEQRAKAATEGIAESSKGLKGAFASTGTRVVRWFWWWSLAAIFVYGVASTLPMAIIRYTIDQKKEKIGARSQGPADSNNNKNGGENTVERAQDAE